MTPATIAATWVMVSSARVQADEDRAAGRKGWAFEYAQDVPPLLAEIERLRVENAGLDAEAQMWADR